MDAYAARLSILLHMEEIQMEVDIRKYDMQHATLQHCLTNPRLLTLNVSMCLTNPRLLTLNVSMCPTNPRLLTLNVSMCLTNPCLLTLNLS